MKSVVAGVCCFLGAWILLCLWSPMRVVVFRAFDFGFTLAFLGAGVVAFVVVKSMGK